MLAAAGVAGMASIRRRDAERGRRIGFGYEGNFPVKQHSRRRNRNGVKGKIGLSSLGRFHGPLLLVS